MTKQSLAEILNENKKLMTLPPIQKAKYLNELRECSRQFYQLLQYQTEALHEELRLYVCTGEVENPNAKILPQFYAGPLLAHDMVRNFLIGDYFRDQEEPFYENGSLWKHWLQN